ncbi:MAG: hypothetical protein HQL51_17010, partial [Magnetococcales bacterium]|nr:hypothetical protein [Magnetococcales bacterium]
MESPVPPASPLAPDAAPVPVVYLAPAFLARFVCDPEACHQECCRHWGIPLGAEELIRLLTAMGGDPQSRLRADRDVIPLEEREGFHPATHAARTRLRKDGSCAFLGQDLRCDIHRQYGEALLGWDCALFPRHVRRLEEGRGTAGAALSCPVAA